MPGARNDHDKGSKEEKHALRREARERVAGLTEEERARYSTEICRRLREMPEWEACRWVGLFAGLAGEPDLRGLTDAKGKRYCFPRVVGEALEFHECDSAADLVRGRWGVLEPVEARGRAVAPEQLELLVVPGLAYDPHGGRLGRGGGYYDRYLAGLGAGVSTVGVCFQVQMRERVPREEHDRAVELVITEEATFRGQ